MCVLGAGKRVRNAHTRRVNRAPCRDQRGGAVEGGDENGNELHGWRWREHRVGRIVSFSSVASKALRQGGRWAVHIWELLDAACCACAAVAQVLRSVVCLCPWILLVACWTAGACIHGCVQRCCLH